METATVEIERGIVVLARRAAEQNGCTVAEQLTHWARLGQAYETVSGFDGARVDAALRHELTPSELEPLERELYNLRQPEALLNPPQDVTAYYQQLGNKTGAVGYDEHGRMVRRSANGELEVLKE